MKKIVLISRFMGNLTIFVQNNLEDYVEKRRI